MDNETLKKFCGLPSEEMIFRENKTWLFLYSAIALIFGVAAPLIDFFQTRYTVVLIPSAFFLILGVVFAIWLVKTKNSRSYAVYCAFQGAVTLAISGVWLNVSIIKFCLENPVFSVWNAAAFLCGAAVCLLLLFHRRRRLKKTEKGEDKPSSNASGYAVTAFSSLVVLALAMLKLSENKLNIYLLPLTVAGTLCMFVIFVFISVNDFINLKLVKKYYAVEENGQRSDFTE